MLTQQEQLRHFEQITIATLHAIDLDTPLQHLQHALQVLLDVPTVLRNGDTHFSEEVLPVLYTLASKARLLCAAADTLTEHVGRAPVLSSPPPTSSHQCVAVAD